MKQNILLVSEDYIKSASLIQLNVDSKTLSRTILSVQQIYLRTILGDTLYNDILNEVETKSTNPSHTIPAIKLELLEEYIIPFLSHSVQQDIVINLSFRITNKGVLRYNDSSASSTSSDDLEYFKNYLENRTSSYKAVLIKYLQDNKLIQDECRTDADISTSSIGWYLESNGYKNCNC